MVQVLESGPATYLFVVLVEDVEALGLGVGCWSLDIKDRMVFFLYYSLMPESVFHSDWSVYVIINYVLVCS